MFFGPAPSATFISGLDAKATADELVKPMLPEWVGSRLRYHIDPTLKTVEASVACGNRGQRIYIIPSEHLIVARFGYSPEPDFGILEDLALIKAAITALRSH